MWLYFRAMPLPVQVLGFLVAGLVLLAFLPWWAFLVLPAVFVLVVVAGIVSAIRENLRAGQPALFRGPLTEGFPAEHPQLYRLDERISGDQG